MRGRIQNYMQSLKSSGPSTWKGGEESDTLKGGLNKATELRLVLKMWGSFYLKGAAKMFLRMS